MNPLIHIEFESVFEANKGLALLRIDDPKNKQWEFRDHNYGSLKYHITDKQLYILQTHSIEFMILNGGIDSNELD